MKVVVVASHIEPTYGLEHAALQLCRNLQDSTAVTLLCFGDPRGAGLQTASNGQRFESYGQPLNGWRRLYSVGRSRRLLATLDSGSSVIAAGIWTSIPLLIANWTLRDRVRVIAWEHSLDAAKVQKSRGLRLLSAIARWAFRRSAQVVAVSRSLSNDLRGLGIDSVVIPNFIESQPVDESDRAGSRVVDRRTRLGVVAALSPVKNVELAISAVALLPPAYTLAVYGDGPLRAELEASAVDKGIQARVTFHGRVARQDIAWHDIDIVVHPALGETFGYTLYEAGSWDVPVVAVEAGVMRDVVPRYVYGALAAPTAADFADKILSCSSPEASEQIGFMSARGHRERDLSDTSLIDAWLQVIRDSDQTRRCNDDGS